MTKKIAVANYSDVQVSTMTSMYTGSDNIAEVRAIATAIDKPVNSVRAKLASLGVYIKAEPTAKVGSTKIKKEVKAQQIGELTGMSELEREALGKTTGAVLDKLLARLTS